MSETVNKVRCKRAIDGSCDGGACNCPHYHLHIERDDCLVDSICSRLSHGSNRTVRCIVVEEVVVDSKPKRKRKRIRKKKVVKRTIKLKTPRLIGMTGKMGSGKTSVSNWFVKEHDFVKLAFAKPLKESLSVLTGLSIEHFTDEKLKEVPIPGIGKSPRELMQLMATEFVREMVHYDFWLWRMRHNISMHSHKDIIIDDVRFENEAKFIRDNGGKIVHLERNFDFASKHKSHKSEQGVEILEHDYVVHAVTGIELTALKVSDLIM